MRRAILFIPVALGLAAILSAPASAQSADDRRLDRLDKQISELRSIVFQGRDTGQPVVVKPAGPDPEVGALGQRLDTMDSGLRQITGQLEVLTHDADEARQSAAAVRDQNGELKGQLKDLTDRVAKLEAAAAPAPPPASTAAVNPGVTAPAGAAPADQVPAGPAAPPTPGDAYKQARALFIAHDYAGAAQAFQAFVIQYGDSPLIPTAYYWLGESDEARQAYADAVPAYANALRGWPKERWASDATVNLSRALAQTNQPDKACAALAEFDRRYRNTATTGAVVKSRAADVRAQAKCGA